MTMQHLSTELQGGNAVLPLERQATNDVMRHIPPIAELIQRVDVVFRRRAEKLFRAAFRREAPPTAEQSIQLDAEFRRVVRSLDRLSEAVKGTRVAASTQGNAELSVRIQNAFNQAVKILSATDAELFQRRIPCHRFDRSRGEAVVGAMAILHRDLSRIIPLVAALNPDIYEILNEGLVVKEHPVNEETLRPIA